ncbi:MAG: hypothetical protein JRC90_11440 [Deltaproteobacteria bacterium]|nr:hypothetical protein [Deltaproteobacteria bacterium]
MANYAPSTRERISDLVAGMRLQTEVFNCATYINHTTNTGQFELFNVFGRILLMHLYIEAITDWGNGASVVSFTYDSNTPAIAVAEICDASDSVADVDQGRRIVWPGGVVGTTATITPSATISDYVAPGAFHYIGSQDGEGTIGMLTATATLASGTAQAFMNYVPLQVGAYVTANAAPATA